MVITLPSRELVKWAQYVSICETVWLCDSHTIVSVHLSFSLPLFLLLLSHTLQPSKYSDCIFLQIYHTLRFALRMKLLQFAADKFPFSTNLPTFFLHSVEILNYCTLIFAATCGYCCCCFFFFFGFSDLKLYIWSVAAMPFSKPHLELDTTMRAKEICQPLPKSISSLERRITLLYDAHGDRLLSIYSLYFLSSYCFI